MCPAMGLYTCGSLKKNDIDNNSDDDDDNDDFTLKLGPLFS